MAINFPNSPTDQQTFVSSGRTYRFNGTSSIWEVVQGTTTTDYNNLTNKPTVPTDVSDLTDTTSLLGVVVLLHMQILRHFHQVVIL